MALDPFHLGSLFALREALHDVSRRSIPTIAPIGTLPSARTIALLPGSFNPPTAAHLLLAERALGEGFDLAVFVLAVRTVGKERAGMILEDRLLALRAMAGHRIGVAVASHGLYADQADAAARAFDGASLTFLLGSDKVMQIFDPRWYGDRDAALDRLFARADLMVAPRWDQAERLRAVLEDPANARYADRVSLLTLHPAVCDLSSTRVRGLLRSGADPAGLVPTPVAGLLARTRAFAAPSVVGSDEVDAYEVRARLIECIWRLHGPAGADLDLQRLIAIACSPTAHGRSFRASLSGGRAGPADLARAIDERDVAAT